MARAPRLGPYAPISASYYRDDAILAAGPDAELLYVRGLAYSADAQSDGYITDRQVALVGVGLRQVKRNTDRLVEVGLWERLDGGYQVKSWLKWNRSMDEIGVTRKLDRDRKAAGKSLDSNGIPDGIQAESDGIPPDSLVCMSGKVEVEITHQNTPEHARGKTDPPDGGIEPTVNVRAQRLAKAYCTLQPMSKFPAVMDIAKRAIAAHHADEQIGDALERIAKEGRSLTVETLRIELEGFVAHAQPQRLSGPARAQRLKLNLEAPQEIAQ